MPVRYVIVGSGIAALSAVEAIRRYERDPHASITVVSEEKHPFYSRPGLAYYLRKDVPERQLVIRTPDEIGRLGMDRIVARVTAVHSVRREIELDHSTRVSYDRLLLTLGARAVRPNFPGNELAGVVTLDGLDDTNRMIALAKKARRAVVIGGGITALELAEGLLARGLKVHFFLRGDRYWGDVLDPIESTIVMDRLRREGIDLHTNTQVQEAIGRAGRLSSVVTQDGTSWKCDLLAAAIGVRPQVELARSAGLAVRKGIVVNPYLVTSCPDIFAAGDCAEVIDPTTGRSDLDVLWPIALAQGRTAGANMTGAGIPYRKEMPFNVTMLAGLKTAVIGQVGSGRTDEDRVAVTRGESETWGFRPRCWIRADHHDLNRVRMVIGERTILGAVVIGEQNHTRMLREIILKQIDIGPIREQLVQGNGSPWELLRTIIA